MARRSSDSNVAWFIAGLTVGFAGALLLAPRSGEQTRQSLVDAVEKGREFAADKRKQATKYGRELYDQGREFVDDLNPAQRGEPVETASHEAAQGEEPT